MQLVLDRVHALAVSTTVDPAERMRGLREQIYDIELQPSRKKEELKRLEEGGDVELASDEHVLTEFLFVRAEMNELPRDIKRVEDSFRSLAQQIREDYYLAEINGDPTRSHGEIVADYLQRAQALATADRPPAPAATPSWDGSPAHPATPHIAPPPPPSTRRGSDRSSTA